MDSTEERAARDLAGIENALSRGRVEERLEALKLVVKFAREEEARETRAAIARAFQKTRRRRAR